MTQDTTSVQPIYARTIWGLMDNIDPGPEKNKLYYAMVVPLVGRLCPSLQESTEYLIHREVVREDAALKSVYELIGEDMAVVHNSISPYIAKGHSAAALFSYAQELVGTLATRLAAALVDVPMDQTKAVYDEFMDAGTAITTDMTAYAMERAIRHDGQSLCTLTASAVAFYSIINLMASNHHMEGGFCEEAENSFIAIWMQSYTNAIAQQRKAVISTYHLQQHHKRVEAAKTQSETVH